MSIISGADKSLLSKYGVTATVDPQQDGIITLGERSFRVSVCFPSKGDPSALNAEKMIETAQKVAVILLKKELIDQNRTEERHHFTIAQKSIQESVETKEGDKETREIEHEDAQNTKDTRSDYQELVRYLTCESKKADFPIRFPTIYPRFAISPQVIATARSFLPSTPPPSSLSRVPAKTKKKKRKNSPSPKIGRTTQVINQEILPQQKKRALIPFPPLSSSSHSPLKKEPTRALPIPLSARVRRQGDGSAIAPLGRKIATCAVPALLRLMK